MEGGIEISKRYKPPPRRRLKIEQYLKIDLCKNRTEIGNMEGIRRSMGNREKENRKKRIAPRAGGS